MSSTSSPDVIDEVAGRTDSLTGARTHVVDSRQNLGVSFNPVAPEAAAHALREAGR